MEKYLNNVALVCRHLYNFFNKLETAVSLVKLNKQRFLVRYIECKERKTDKLC